MKSYHSGCVSAPVGPGEAKLPLPQGCCFASSCRAREQWRRRGCFPVQEQYSRGKHRNLILLGYNNRQEHNSALGRVWALITKLHKTQQLHSTPYCKGSVISTLFYYFLILHLLCSPCLQEIYPSPAHPSQFPALASKPLFFQKSYHLYSRLKCT